MVSTTLEASGFGASVNGLKMRNPDIWVNFADVIRPHSKKIKSWLSNGYKNDNPPQLVFFQLISAGMLVNCVGTSLPVSE